MTTSIVINALPTNTPPAQVGKHLAPDMVNDDFLGGFADLLDVFNPLQHLPIISTLYREFTGDALSTGAQLAGGALFGGPMGFVASLVNSIIEQETGKDIGANIYSAVTGNYQKAAALS